MVTPFGFFAYNKLPFGVSASPLLFQEIVEKVIAGIPHCAAYQDDIIIGTPDKQSHEVVLSQVKQRLKAHSFVINEAKSSYFQPAVRYLGFVLQNGSLCPDPERIKVFRELEMPKDKAQLHSLLGTLRYYGDFTSQFSQLTKPLYALLRKDSVFEWTDELTVLVKKAIDEVSEGILHCYEVDQPLYLTCDASAHGLGFVLSHDSEMKVIVATGGRILSPAEENYSNIEREALAIVAGLKHFDKYLAGRKFSIQTDHAPLKYMMNKKALSKRLSHRLERWALELSCYDYDIAYRKGSDINMPDAISRLTKNADFL